MSHIYILTDEQDQLEAEPILRKIFANDDPFDNLFSLNISERLILYRCESYLEAELIEGLISAAFDLGDTHCYLTNLSPSIDPQTHIIEPNHYYILLSELSEEQVGSSNNINFNFWIDYVIYSPQEKWGLMRSYEYHALLGGSAEFINKVREFVPNLDEQVEVFLQKFKSISSMTGRKFDWLPKLLTHTLWRRNC